MTALQKCLCRLPQCNNLLIASTSKNSKWTHHRKFSDSTKSSPDQPVNLENPPFYEGIDLSQTAFSRGTSAATTLREKAPFIDRSHLSTLGGKEWLEISPAARTSPPISTQRFSDAHETGSQAWLEGEPKIYAINPPSVALAQEISQKKLDHLRTLSRTRQEMKNAQTNYYREMDPFWARVTSGTRKEETKKWLTPSNHSGEQMIDPFESRWRQIIAQQNSSTHRSVRDIDGVEQRKYLADIRGTKPPENPAEVYELLVRLSQTIPRTPAVSLLTIIRNPAMEPFVDDRVLGFILERAYEESNARCSREVWDEMMQRGIKPNERICRAVVKHYMLTNNRRQAENVVQYMANKGWAEPILVLNRKRQLGSTARGVGDPSKHRMIRVSRKVQVKDANGPLNPFYGVEEFDRPKVRLPNDIHTISTCDICPVIESLVQERAESSAYHTASAWLAKNRQFLVAPSAGATPSWKVYQLAGHKSLDIIRTASIELSVGFSLREAVAKTQYTRIATVLLNVLLKSLLMSGANRQSQKDFIEDFCQRNELEKGTPLAPNHITLSTLAGRSDNGARSFSSKILMIDWVGEKYGVPPIGKNNYTRIYFDNYYNHDCEKHVSEQFGSRHPQASFPPHYYVAPSVAGKLLKYAIKDFKRLQRLVARENKRSTVKSVKSHSYKSATIESTSDKIDRLVSAKALLESHKDRILKWWKHLDFSSEAYMTSGLPALIRTAKQIKLIEGTVHAVKDNHADTKVNRDEEVQAELISDQTENTTDSVPPKLETDSIPVTDVQHSVAPTTKSLHRKPFSFKRIPEELLTGIDKEISEQRSSLDLAPRQAETPLTAIELEDEQSNLLMKRAIEKLRSQAEELGDQSGDHFDMVMGMLRKQTGHEDRFHFSLAKSKPSTVDSSRSKWM